MIEYLFWGSRR